MEEHFSLFCFFFNFGTNFGLIHNSLDRVLWLGSRAPKTRRRRGRRGRRPRPKKKAANQEQRSRLAGRRWQPPVSWVIWLHLAGFSEAISRSVGGARGWSRTVTNCSCRPAAAAARLHVFLFVFFHLFPLSYIYIFFTLESGAVDGRRKHASRRCQWPPVNTNNKKKPTHKYSGKKKPTLDRHVPRCTNGLLPSSSLRFSLSLSLSCSSPGFLLLFFLRFFFSLKAGGALACVAGHWTLVAGCRSSSRTVECSTGSSEARTHRHAVHHLLT